MLVLYNQFENFELNKIFEDIMSCHCPFYSSELMEALNYDDEDNYQNALRQALRACASLNVPVRYHFQIIYRSSGKGTYKDYKLSHFACYLVTMNADPSNEKVAQAQLYFFKNKNI